MFKKQEADFVAIIVPMLDISEHRPEVLTHLWSMRIAIQGKLGQINAIDPIKVINQLYEMTYRYMDATIITPTTNKEESK